MSKQPLGKTLLRNVIRHTDAHNKIQEEMEMWKMRNWEVNTSHNKHLPDTKSERGQMHCDRVSDQPRDLSRSRERVSEHDDREARYWSRKLYEFKASDPDRWGHSGFKELYPEELESDSEKSSATRKVRRHKNKKSKSDTEASLSKRSKKSSRKKKKKKKKKDEEEKRRKEECSSSDSSSDDSSATKDKQQMKKTKSRHKNKKAEKNRGRDEDSSSGDINGSEERERRTLRRKKRKQDSHKDSDSGPNSKKKSRKDWKAAGESLGDTS
ncbi:NKAP domain containing 1 [Anoplopoma fimbria]|uniref:NKAP domain containing 1 n=1 Tax=Anoplopoma fimbria TaxID=229290 RepID=UPI0023EAB520|nr:NKAP domain containing 1 [Anoplopoma fimbria]XP_054457685.1 NKAP domain containing 1 [Anoplopoma fimbria]